MFEFLLGITLERLEIQPSNLTEMITTMCCSVSHIFELSLKDDSGIFALYMFEMCSLQL